MAYKYSKGTFALDKIRAKDDAEILDDKKLKFGTNGDVTFEYDEDGADVLQIAGGDVRFAHGANNKFQIRDDAIYLQSSADGQLDLVADSKVKFTAGTVEASADLKVGDDLSLTSDSAVMNFGADNDVTLTHVHDTGLRLNKAMEFAASTELIKSDGSNGLQIKAQAGILLDSDSASWKLSDGGTQIAHLAASGQDLVFKDTDDVEIFRIDESADSLLMAGGNAIEFRDSNAYIKHDGTDLKIADDADINLVAGANVLLDAEATIILDSKAGDISFQDNGAAQLAIDMDGTAGEIIMQLKVDSDDFVFKQYDGTEVFRVEDDGAFDIAGGAGSSGVTVTAAGQLTADGRVIIDDATEATSTTDGSLQTDGGLSVAKSAVIGDDLDLLSDSAILSLGAGKDVTLTHDGGTGATLASAGAFLIDGAAAVSIDGASGINIGTNDSGAAISIGHSTSEVTVNDNLTVTGDLVVNGATTTVSTTNMVVEDKFIELGNGVTGSPSGDAGFVIERGDDDNVAMIWDESADEFFLGSGTVTGASTGNLSLTAANLQAAVVRSSKLEIDGASDYIDVATDLKLVAAADILLDPAGGDVKVDGNLIPNADNGGALGASGTEWSDLFLNSGAVVNFDGGDVTMTHSSNLLAIAGGNTRVARLELDGASDYLDVDTNLKIVAAADILLDPAGGDVKVDGNLLPNADNGGALGASGTEWSDLFLNSGAVVNFDGGDVTMTHASNKLTIAGGETVVGALSTAFSGSVTGSSYPIQAAEDFFVGVDSSANTVNVILPTAAAAGAGKMYVVKDIGGNASSNNITITGSAATNRIDGAVGAITIDSPYGAVNFMSDGSSKWYVW